VWPSPFNLSLLSWPAALGVLQASYFFIHYLFASQTGHVGALYSAFLAMHLAAGVPGVLAALALAYNTNLFGALTHYSSGQAAVYYGGMTLLCISHIIFVDSFFVLVF
jgi:di/tricarboxylate transporter